MAHLKSRVQNEIDFFNKCKVSMENKTVKSTHFRDGKKMHLIGYITNVCSIHIQNSMLSHGFFDQSHISNDIYKFIYQYFGPKA